MPEPERKRLNYIVVVIGAFAERRGITPSEAFLYLYQNGGISFLMDYYEIEHTLPPEDVMDDLERVCSGGVSA